MESECTNQCGVCFDSSNSTINHIIECIECGIHVHCKCYGIHTSKIYDDWCCDVCNFKKHHNTPFPHTLNMKCTLCPNHNAKDVLKQRNNGEWAHIFCSVWNDNNNENTSSSSLCCIICAEQYGMTHKCFHPQCNTYFHPLCGKYKNYSQIIYRTSRRSIFIQFCMFHFNTDIHDIIKCEEHIQSKVGPIRFEQENEVEESVDVSFLSRTNSSNSVTESEDDMTSSRVQSLNEIEGLSLDEKLQRNDIALNKKEVIELLWNRTDKYHEAVTTKDYLRIAPHDYYNDPLFSTPNKGKTDLFDTETTGNNHRYNDNTSSDRVKNGLSDIIESEEEEEENEWTLNGIKNKLLNKINNDNVSEQKVNNKAMTNELPTPLNDDSVSLIAHQLGLSSKHPPSAVFGDEREDAESVWNGDESSYRVDMDPFGWRWVLKHTQIPPNITQISCPCLLCKYICNEYQKRRESVCSKAIHNPLCINKEPDIINKHNIQRQKVWIRTKHGRVLCEYSVKNDDYQDIKEYKTILNETETENGLQPRMVNIMEKIAYKRWSTQNNVNNNSNHNGNVVIKDESSSIYHIDSSCSDKRGIKRKRSSECNGYKAHKKRRINDNSNCNLDSIRSLDSDVSCDLNNSIGDSIYESILRLYSVMRVNDDRKHMLRTKLRSAVELDCVKWLSSLYSSVIEHSMKHICIWQQIRGHFECGFSDKCGIFNERRCDYDDVSVCCVCFDGAFTDSNPIIFCDDCNIGVHRFCYGIKCVPSSHAEWLCVKCSYISLSPQCCLCPIVGGALKRTKEGGFAHISCAMWIDRIEIGDISRMSPILNVSSVINKCARGIETMHTYLLSSMDRCIICGETEGCFIKCIDSSCLASFHVLCGWFAGQYMVINNMEYIAYCADHTPINVGGKHRNFNKFCLLRKQGLTENESTAQIHRRSRILNTKYLNINRDEYLAEQCAVCFVDGSDGVICTNCGIYVHFVCYGLSNECAEWICDLCAADDDSIQCVLCPRKGGALKLAENRYWVHLSCILYISSTSFVKNVIYGVKALMHKINNNICYLCHQFDGCTIKCTKNKCNLYYHVTCALFSCFSTVFCRKHCAILQIKGGVDHITENLKLLKLRKTYHLIKHLLFLMKQTQERNLEIMKQIIEKQQNINIKYNTDSAINAINTIYHDDDDMTHFNDPHKVNKLIHFANYIENQSNNIKENHCLKEKQDEDYQEEDDDIQNILASTANQMKYCKLCGRARGKGWSISVWMKHLNNKHIYSCDECEFRTTLKKYLKDHMTRKHK